MSTRLEDYALIGDCEAAALVSRGGSIDWLCWPRFDSAACFAALLGGREHGRWLIEPIVGSADLVDQGPRPQASEVRAQLSLIFGPVAFALGPGAWAWALGPGP